MVTGWSVVKHVLRCQEVIKKGGAKITRVYNTYLLDFSYKEFGRSPLSGMLPSKK